MRAPRMSRRTYCLSLDLLPDPVADTLQSSPILMKFIDTVEPTRSGVLAQYEWKGGARTYLVPALVGIATLAVSIVVGFTESFREQFYFSYLVGWTFCLSLALGALFVVLVKHLTKASWIVAVRRIPEALAVSFPLLALLSIPILIGLFDGHGLYHHWSVEGIADPSSSHFDEVLAGKVAYLNKPFFLIRLAFYFFIWTLVSSKLWSLSLRQDLSGDPAIAPKQRKVSAWGLPLVAITTAFGSYDLLMSLDPHWFSTIFGVYFFAGAFMAAFSLIALACMFLQRCGMLRGVVTKEHYHDLGKLMFAFVVFWAYIAFSQYMLYWYGGIPEETVWFRHRLEHGWETHSAILLVAHFILPFVILLPRGVKRTLPLLAIMAVWLLVMQWFDHHWIAMPVLHYEHATFHWLDISCWIGLTALFVSAFLWRLSRHALVPQGDPLLAKSLRFENA